jgi:hypothetical protein
MRGHDLSIAGVEDRLLAGSLGQCARMIQEVAVQRVFLRDQEDQALAPATDSAAALPRCQNRSRISHQQADVEAADVYPHLQRRGRDHAGQLSVEESPLDVPALFGQKPAPVGRDARCQLGLGLQDPGMHELRHPTGLGEGDGS